MVNGYWFMVNGSVHTWQLLIIFKRCSASLAAARYEQIHLRLMRGTRFELAKSLRHKALNLARLAAPPPPQFMLLHVSL